MSIFPPNLKTWRLKVAAEWLILQLSLQKVFVSILGPQPRLIPQLQLLLANSATVP
jgi:hypothetical protein